MAHHRRPSGRLPRVSAWMLSSDSHVMEPPGSVVCRARRPRRGAPRVEPGEDADWWIIDGQRLFSFSVRRPRRGWLRGTRAAHRRLSVRRRAARFVPARTLTSPTTSPTAFRGSVLYPSVATMLYGLDDGDAVRRLARIYNDWLAGGEIMRPIACGRSPCSMSTTLTLRCRSSCAPVNAEQRARSSRFDARGPSVRANRPTSRYGRPRRSSRCHCRSTSQRIDRPGSGGSCGPSG